MYLILLTTGLCASYLLLFFLFPVFFRQTVKPLSSIRPRVLAYIIAISILVLWASLITPEPLGNRLLHVFGGGFLMFIVCFWSARDSGTSLTKLQFFLFSFLIVTALGVVNEIAEFILQNYTNGIFADSINDTWLDLISNWVGALLAAILVIPFAKKLWANS